MVGSAGRPSARRNSGPTTDVAERDRTYWLMKATMRNLIRSKLRTSLTVLGIAVGALALTMMGAMSEKINLLVEGANRFYNTRIVVQPASTAPGQLFGPLISADVALEVERLPGVDALPDAEGTE